MPTYFVTMEICTLQFLTFHNNVCALKHSKISFNGNDMY